MSGEPRDTCALPPRAGNRPADLSDTMFAIARAIRQQAASHGVAAGTPDGHATVIVRAEVIARIACGVGALARELARADLAYAEGTREATRAAGEAVRQTAGVTLDLRGRLWRVGQDSGATFDDDDGDFEGHTLTIELRGEAEIAAVETLLTAAQLRGGITLGLAPSNGDET